MSGSSASRRGSSAVGGGVACRRWLAIPKSETNGRQEACQPDRPEGLARRLSLALALSKGCEGLPPADAGFGRESGRIYPVIASRYGKKLAFRAPGAGPECGSWACPDGMIEHGQAVRSHSSGRCPGPGDQPPGEGRLAARPRDRPARGIPPRSMAPRHRPHPRGGPRERAVLVPALEGPAGPGALVREPEVRKNAGYDHCNLREQTIEISYYRLRAHGVPR
jgi:hypothetical protein